MPDVLLGGVKALDCDLGVTLDDVRSVTVSLLLLVPLDVVAGPSNVMPIRFFRLSITMDAFLTA
jgi:hypothetical protein